MSSECQSQFKTKWWFDNGRGSAEAPRVIWDRELPPRFPNGLDLYLEIGVCEGHSMRWVLENLRPRLAIGMDPYIPKKRDLAEESATHKTNMSENLRSWIESRQCLIYCEKSQDLLKASPPVVNDLSCDLIYVDGDHNALPALTDMVLAWPKLKVGGIMILDDYNKRWQLGRPHAKEAIDCFLDAAESRYDWEWGPTRKIWCCQVAVRKIKA